MRTLILVTICAAFAGIAVLEARSTSKSRTAMLRDAVIGFVIGLLCCWILVRWVGIFDGWRYSLRR